MSLEVVQPGLCMVLLLKLGERVLNEHDPLLPHLSQQFVHEAASWLTNGLRLPAHARSCCGIALPAPALWQSKSSSAASGSAAPACRPHRLSASLSCWTSSGVSCWQRPTMRRTVLPSISPWPSPVDFVFACSHAAWLSKSLGKTSRLGSVFAGSPIRTAAIIRMNFKEVSSTAFWISHAALYRPEGATSDGAKRAP